MQARSTADAKKLRDSLKGLRKEIVAFLKAVSLIQQIQRVLKALRDYSTVLKQLPTDSAGDSDRSVI